MKRSTWSCDKYVIFMPLRVTIPPTINPYTCMRCTCTKKMVVSFAVVN